MLYCFKTLSLTWKRKIIRIEPCLFEQLINKTGNNKQTKQWNVVSDLYCIMVKMNHWVNKNTFSMYSILKAPGVVFTGNIDHIICFSGRTWRSSNTWTQLVVCYDCISSTLNPFVILEKSLLSDLMDCKASLVEIGFTWLVPSRPCLLASSARRWLTLVLILEHSSLLSCILRSLSISYT